MIRTKIETNFTIFFTMWKSSPQATTPSPLEKKSKSLHVLPSSQNMPNMYTLYNPLPRTCTWTPDHGLRRRCSCSSCQSPQRLPPPPFFEKFLDPRHDVVLVLHFCGSNCQYMYRYMYMHPPPTPTKYRLFTIRKHAFLSLFLNDAMLRACRSM